MEYNLRDDLSIDPHNLHTGWESQANLVIKYGQLHVEAVRLRNEAKRDVKIMEARLDQVIRLDPKAYGWFEDKKPTEVWIAHTIAQHPDCLDAQEALAEAEYQADMLRIAMDSLRDRKDSLNGLQQLFLAGYYTRQYMPDERAKEEVGAIENQEGQEGNLRRRAVKSRD